MKGGFIESTIRGLHAAMDRGLQAEQTLDERGLLQRLNPRVKVAGFALFVLVSAAARQLWVVAVVLLIGVALAVFSRISLATLATRVWLITLPFSVMLALPAVFLTGVRPAAMLVLRAETAATLALVLVFSTPWTHVLKALRMFRVPVVFVVILGMTCRYILLLLENAHEMFESRRSRTVGALTRSEQRRMAILSAGALFGRTLWLSNEVYLAMQARGFRGEVFVMDDFRMGSPDWVALIASGGVSAALAWAGALMLFEIERLVYRYERTTALDGLSLSIAEGSRVALLGSNGSGKSTLLRVLDGLYFGESGRVAFRGEDLTEERFGDDEFAFGFRRQVGLVFQNPDAQLFNPTVFDEVAFGPLQMRLPKPEIRERVMETLEWLRIAHLKDRAPQRLSGGEKKRVALASVLVLDPAVVLLDEPTAGLDPRSQSQMIDLLVAWGGETKSVVIATHDLGDLRDTVDHCYVLDRGSLAAEGSPEEILGDGGLLERTNLVHRHRHRGGVRAEIHRH